MSIHKSGTDDGWHGVIKEGGDFPPEPGRYHMYIGLFCPFAHRANLVRHLCGLQSTIPLSIVMPYPKGTEGWRFPETNSSYPNATTDNLFNSKFLHEVYFKDDPEYKGKYSVPFLWDTKTNKAVNNESAEMLRWLPSAFPSHTIDLYPVQHRAQVDELSVWLQSDLNTGVYKAGFAPDQAAYDAAVPKVFAALNKLEALVHRNGGPYILGKDMTELDLRVFATIIRFDTVYVQHFKCNLGTIRHDYPVLNNWLKGLYWHHDAFRDTTDFKHIKENYTKSHHDINPKSITPMGPVPDVEPDYESDWSKLKPGRVDLPVVNDHEAKL